MSMSLIGVEAHSKELSPYPNLEKDVELQQGATLVIQNTNNTLFWEFENFDDAIAKIKNLDNCVIGNIRNSNSLLELSKDNWYTYRDIFVEKKEEEILSNQKPELQRLYEFFIVCDNMEVNKLAVSMYDSGDCANFTSQILRAGGMPNDASWSPYTSVWSVAHNFAVYWYSRSYSQTSTIYYNTFLNDARPGDFIAQDFQNDGRYDYIGFIVGGSGSGLIIAQHSENYYGSISGRPGWKNDVKKWIRIRFAA